MENDFERLIEFINEYGLSAVDKNGNNIFLLCCTIDIIFTGLVEKIIEQNKELNINFQNKYGWAALHIMVQDKNKKLMELLLSKNDIKVDIEDINGGTPLLKALLAEKYDEDIIIRLLEAGADINKIDIHGYRYNEFINESMEKVNKYIRDHNIIKK